MEVYGVTLVLTSQILVFDNVFYMQMIGTAHTCMPIPLAPDPIRFVVYSEQIGIAWR